MKVKSLILLIVISFVFVGCTQEPEIEFKRPKMQVPKNQK